MKNRVLKGEKGFAASDGLIAILIITLFAGLIATVSYNIYLANSSIKRMSKATSYIVDMFEYIDKTYYDDVKIENIKSSYNYLNEHIDTEEPLDENMQRLGILTGTVDDSYEVTLILDRYYTEENSFDLVKQVKMQVKYKLGNKDQVIEMKTIKQRENLVTPNKPDLSLFGLQDGEKKYPIKNTSEGWVVCDSRDNSWYNYESGNWAILLTTDKDLSIGEQVDIDNLSEKEATYAWIPRFAYDEVNEKIVFLFSNSDKFIQYEEDENGNGYNKLLEIGESYTISSDFNSLEGIWTNNPDSETYIDLNNVYPLNI